MQLCCKPHSVLTKTSSRGSMSGASQAVSPIEDRGPPPGLAPIFGSHGSMSSITSTSSVGSMGTIPANIPVANDINTSDNHLLQRSDSQVSQSSTATNVSSTGRRSDEPPPLPPSRISFHRQGSQSQATLGEDSEDTMKNLRKTFAGIFGEM